MLLNSHRFGPPPAPPVTSRAIALWMMDDSADALNGNTLDLKSSTTIAMPNGQTGRRIASGGSGDQGLVALYANGTMIAGGGHFTMCGFVKCRNVFNSNAIVGFGDNSGFWLSDSLKLRMNNQKLRLQWRDHTGANQAMELSPSYSNNATLFVGLGYDGTNVWLKASTNGTTWASNTMAVGMGNELYQGTKISFGMSIGGGGAETDMSQWLLTREDLDETDLAALANSMNGLTKAAIEAIVGDYPALASLSVTQHANPFIQSTSIGTACMFMRPYPLHSYDAGLAASLGRYVWFTGGDHDGSGAGTGIFMGFSQDPGVPPTSWTEIWDAPGSIAGYEQSETPWLVYNPDDATRPFYLYFHEYVLSGVPGYSNSQTRRLLSSANLSSWTNEGVVMSPFTGNVVQFQYFGYQCTFRTGTNQWESMGPITDAFTFQGRLTSTDGKTWTPENWFSTSPKRLNEEQWTPPGYRVNPRYNIVTIDGVEHVITKMDAATGSSVVDPYTRYVVAAPINAGRQVSGYPKIVTQHTGSFDTTSYVQEVMAFEEDGVIHIYETMDFHQPDFSIYSTLIADEATANTARPVGFRKTSLGGGQVKLDWYDALPHQNYRVYRDTGGGYSLLASVTGLTYTDTPGGNASYKIRSIHSAVESADSAILTFTP